MRFKMVMGLAVLIASVINPVFAQNTMDDVRLIQSFFRDTPITSQPYGDGGIEFNSFESANMFGLGVRGGYPINEKIEMNVGLRFLNFSYDVPEGIPGTSDSQSGLSDLTVAARYNLVPKKSKISAGGYVTLPIGSEDVGQSRLNFGAFGSLRHPINSQIVITGVVGIDFLETEKLKYEKFKWVKSSDYEFSLRLAGGGIYALSPELSLIGELELMTEGDYMLLSGGADYKLQNLGRLRGALGLGLDDGAPDFQILGSFIYNFNLK